MSTEPLVPAPTAEDAPPPEAAPAEMTAPDLVELVTAVPGVGGIEPGIATTLRAVDARMRGRADTSARYGLVLDRAAGTAIVEIGIAGELPVRSVVEQVQRAVQDAVGRSGDEPFEVLVRVQSVSQG